MVRSSILLNRKNSGSIIWSPRRSSGSTYADSNTSNAERRDARFASRWAQYVGDGAESGVVGPEERPRADIAAERGSFTSLVSANPNNTTELKTRTFRRCDGVSDCVDVPAAPPLPLPMVDAVSAAPEMSGKEYASGSVAIISSHLMWKSLMALPMERMDFGNRWQ